MADQRNGGIKYYSKYFRDYNTDATHTMFPKWMDLAVDIRARQVMPWISTGESLTFKDVLGLFPREIKRWFNIGVSEGQQAQIPGEVHACNGNQREIDA
jgi:hypothetical protein